MARIIPPTDLEATLRTQGTKYVAGVDEAGRGCLAGPVVAGAVILPPEMPGDILICDSKQLSAKQREVALAGIQEHAIAWAVGVVDAARIDEVNILQAALQAMCVAVEHLPVAPQHLLIDGRERIPLQIPQTALVKGDQRSLSVAAASILAKVTRDRMMVDLHSEFPEYAFATHKGYGTKQHLDALQQYGVTNLHRKSFAPVRAVLG